MSYNDRGAAYHDTREEKMKTITNYGPEVSKFENTNGLVKGEMMINVEEARPKQEKVENIFEAISGTASLLVEQSSTNDRELQGFLTFFLGEDELKEDPMNGDEKCKQPNGAMEELLHKLKIILDNNLATANKLSIIKENLS